VLRYQTLVSVALIHIYDVCSHCLTSSVVIHWLLFNKSIEFCEFPIVMGSEGTSALNPKPATRS
jgi:hypothetical protein